jgi:hypothetical protein
MTRVRTLDDLEPSHLDELREFHTLGREIASRLVDGPRDDVDDVVKSSPNEGPPPASAMKIGYHALPSLEPLHLHMISDDMDSPCVTERRHVTSFVSPLFFVSAEAVEHHLEGAFDDDLSIRVRRERARDVLESTPLTCVRCGRAADTVRDWKLHHRLCDWRATADDGRGGKTTGGKTLNSLLGWRRRLASTEASACVLKPSDLEATMIAKRGNSMEGPGYIVPMTPARFTICESRTRYLIYMAIREGKESKFARGLARCDDVIHDELRHCLQLEETRHVTMYDGYLSADQVRGLNFRGRFEYPIEIQLDGWKDWEAGAYLGVSRGSECDLRRLLNEVDGIPRHRDGKEEKCDHLSLYRRRGETRMPYDQMKREFWSMRTTTKSHDWGIVEGMSIRIKAYGGPYFDCRVLADATTACRGEKLKWF